MRLTHLIAVTAAACLAHTASGLALAQPWARPIIDASSAGAGKVAGWPPAILSQPGGDDLTVLDASAGHRGGGAPWYERRSRRQSASDAPEVWTFDRLDRIGGHAATVRGSPRVIETPIGNAIEFDGVDDALFIEVHPLAGAKTFTWEAIFRPDGGNREQRWFHLQETGSENRMLFEIRVAGDRWFLDSYTFSATGERALMNKNRLYPVGGWYHVAAVYDGTVFSSYVNGVKQAEAEIALAPQGAGRTSIGVRINLVDYFKGAISWARFTRRALTPEEFFKIRTGV